MTSILLIANNQAVVSNPPSPSRLSSQESSVKGFRSDSAGSRSNKTQSHDTESRDSQVSCLPITEITYSVFLYFCWIYSFSNLPLSEFERSVFHQQSKSDSLQSKTSSDEYIPVPRAPYDPSENYENVRYHHRSSSATQVFVLGLN